MPILVEKTKNNNPIFMETKYGYFIYGQYYKKGSYSPVPFKFLTEADPNMSKKVPITNRGFNIYRTLYSSIFPTCGSVYVEDNKDPNTYYVFTSAVYDSSSGAYESGSEYYSVYKIYETENEFKILKHSRSGYNVSSYSNLIYIGQDDRLIFMQCCDSQSSYRPGIHILYINKDTMAISGFIPKSYSASGSASQIIFEDEECIISTGHYFYNNSYNKTSHEINYLKKSIGSSSATYSSTYYNGSYEYKVKSDPDDNSQYKFNNDGVKSDEPDIADSVNTLSYANYYNVPNLHMINDSHEIYKKHRAVFSKDDGTVETYRLFFGYRNSNGSDNILVNIGRFSHDITAIKTKGTSLTTGSSSSYVTVKTCEITNSDSSEFQQWRTRVSNPGHYYMVCEASKFENPDNTYLVFNMRQCGDLCYKNVPGSYVGKQAIAVFKIDKDDSSKLTFISSYAEDIHGHMTLYPLNEEYQILATSGGWRLLKFDYTLGVFKPITFRNADSGCLSMDKEGILYSTVDNYTALEFFRIQNGPYRPEAYFKIKKLSMDGQAEIKDEVIVKSKDFIGNNINSTVHVMLDGENIKFDDNNEKEIDVQISSIEDSKSLPITVTGSGTFGVKCYAKDLKSTD